LVVMEKFQLWTIQSAGKRGDGLDVHLLAAPDEK